MFLVLTSGFFSEASHSHRMARCYSVDNCSLLPVWFLLLGFGFVWFGVVPSPPILLLFYEMEKGNFLFSLTELNKKKSIIWCGSLLHKISVNLAELFVILATEILTFCHFEGNLFLIYFKFLEHKL